MACKNSGVNHSSDESFSHVDAAKPSGNGCGLGLWDSRPQDRKNGHTPPLQYSSVMERNGRRPHKRLIAKASGVWVRQGYRGAAEWGVGLGGATRSEEVHRGGHVPSAEGPRSGGRCIRRILKRVWSGGGGRRRLGQLQPPRESNQTQPNDPKRETEGSDIFVLILARESVNVQDFSFSLIDSHHLDSTRQWPFVRDTE
ncbi:hypothetical protein FOIG_13992 [Fusarium odoratissimum NRRL 54006]|uniref:Uncharacterized protein n=2 Tax=Fusarium oxysporum species complex TaxID=171631 RepID=X0IW29_FUSO5|nr:uncharacterized protein FOIG_13992 [Fusarium odoratissimum NRRL 54006]EXL93122.1 hypothetical protein FOIG_13992 [Fusarium odoratissimum NRRL 54006]TXC11254.1 hypothetical protein FocTR4_00007682 [Fusarium oxysporum f. sp. cubense]